VGNLTLALDLKPASTVTIVVNRIKEVTMSESLTCALPADEADRRARQTRSDLAPSVLAREEINGGLRLRFPANPAIERQVREAVDAESRCCSFLAMQIQPVDGELELTVTGPPEAKPMIELLFA
jgi:hypothetical protein